MKKPTDMKAKDFDQYISKMVVVTYTDKEKSGGGAQILRGVLDQVELGDNSSDKPVQLVIRNESGERLKVSVFELEAIREDG